MSEGVKLGAQVLDVAEAKLTLGAAELLSLEEQLSDLGPVKCFDASGRFLGELHGKVLGVPASPITKSNRLRSSPTMYVL